MKETLQEIAEFTGKACGTIAKDVGEFSQPLVPLAKSLAKAFRAGWREAMTEPSQGESAPASSGNAPQSA